MEIKNLEFKDLDVKDGIVKGYFSAFGNVDSDGDKIVKGAYAKTLQERGNRIAHLFMHDWHSPIGKIQSLKEDDYGLYFESKLSKSSLGEDVLKMYKEEIIKEHSVGFYTMQDEMEGNVRIIKEIQLFEGSSVLVGANNMAKVVKAFAWMNQNGKDEGLFESIKAQLEEMQNSLKSIEAANTHLEDKEPKLDLIAQFNKSWKKN